MTAKYDDMFYYLSKHNILKIKDAAILDEEIIYFQNIKGSLYYLSIGRKNEYTNWSWSCKKQLVKMLKNYSNCLVYTDIDSNINTMTKLLLSQGFKQLSFNEFYKD